MTELAMGQNPRRNKMMEFPEFIIVSIKLHLFRGPAMVGVCPSDQ